MDTEVKIRDRDAITVLSRRRSVRLSDIGPAIGSELHHVYGHLEALGIRASDAPFIVYLEMPDPKDGPFEIEICAPVRRPVDPPAGWQLAELPGGVFASVVHEGPYSTLGETYDSLGGWIPAHGYVVAGPPREVYLSEASTPPEQTRTVVEFPVEARATAGTTTGR